MSKLAEILGEDYEDVRLAALAKKVEKGDYMPQFYEWLPQCSPEFRWEWNHVKFLSEEYIQGVIDGRIKKLMFFMPPRHLKTTLVTFHLATFFLEKNQQNRIIIGAYNQTLANKFSVKIRGMATKRGVRLSKARRARDDWETAKGGGLRAVGVGAGIAGIGGDLIIIDDPVRSRKDASSKTIRDSTYDWYTDDVYTRRENDAPVIICQCLPGDSLVLMSDKSWRYINQVLPDEEVMTWNDGRFEPKKVELITEQPLSKVYTIDTEKYSVRATDRHPFLVKKNDTYEYVQTQDLQIGDEIVCVDDMSRPCEFKTAKVKQVSYYNDDVTYDLSVDDNHNFIVNGLVCHNTRWHELDLSGQILQNEGVYDPVTNPNGWHVVILPALAEPNDMMGRKIGQALWPNRFNEIQLNEIRAVMGRGFEALYQQRPIEMEGGMFKRSTFKIIDGIPSDDTDSLMYIRFWDKGSTDNDGDFTAGVLLAYSRKTKKVYVVDVVHGQWSTNERDQKILSTARLDKETYGDVRIRHEQEPGGAGKDSVNSLHTIMASFPIKAIPSRTNKVLRAEPFSGQVQAGNVYLIRANWNHDFIEEFCTFPSGKNDDRVDATSGAYNEISQGLRAFIKVGGAM